MKKRLSFCLILVVLLSLAVPAHAISVQGNSETVITAEPYLPDIEIEVVVPTAGNVYINPDQIPVKIDGGIVNKQIVSDTFSIENLSQVPLKVNVEVTGKIKSESDMSLATQSVAKVTTPLKKAFMYFEIKTASDPSAVTWAGAYSPSKHVMIRESMVAKKNIAILGFGDQDKRFGVFHLAGDCVQKPKNPWSSEDGVEVEVVFTFSPLPVGTAIP